MKVTLSLDRKLVWQVRRIAAEQGTTLTGLVREYLEKLAAHNASAGQKRRNLEALERSFEKIHLRMGKRTWKREDLYERS
jgi:hypothetical protein